MDTKQITNKLDQLNLDLSDWPGTGDVTTIYNTIAATDTLTLTGGATDMSWGLNNINGVFDWNDTITTTGPGNLAVQGTVDINGHNADIKINGVSLCDTLRDLQQRLGWMVPNPALEKEWQELRELGDRYRALEAQCQQKSEMWQSLNRMPPPEKL